MRLPSPPRAICGIFLAYVFSGACAAGNTIAASPALRPENAAQLAALRQTMREFFPVMKTKRVYGVPEYKMDLTEAVMSVDLDTADTENPLFLHEPVLRALPPYSTVFLFAPTSLTPKIRERLMVLGMSERVRILPKPDEVRRPFGGLTRWVRDTMLVARDPLGPVLLASLAHKDYTNIVFNDLDYLDGLERPNRRLVRLPVFINGGNVLVVAREGRRILLVGSRELTLNRQWMAQGLGLDSAPQDLTGILQAAMQVDEVVVLPNSQHLYHLDMTISPLKDGIIGVLQPTDPAQVAQADREVLTRIRSTLHGLGFKVIDIPTSAQRIKDYQSPANAVPFKDRRNGKKRVLVPQFPEPANQDPAKSLNLKVLAAYRSAGVDPIPVEDRFHLRFGSIHCALVPLR